MTRPAAETVLGIDLGTGSVRAGLYSLAGDLVAVGEEPVATAHPMPGWAEQCPDEVLAGLQRSVTAVTAGRPPPAAICVASTAVTAVPVGPDDAPAGAALLWMDTRAASEAAEITRTGHPVLQYTGGQVSPEWMLPKALRLARHDPRRYGAARRIVDVHDWVMFRLTGSWTLAEATISAEWSYDPLAGGWPADLLAGLGVERLLGGWDVDKLPAGAAAGFLTAAAAARLGLPAGIPVVQCLMDSYAAALAADVFRRGPVAVSIGTSSSYLGLSAYPVHDARLLGPVPGALGPGTIVQQGGQTSAPLSSSGSAASWPPARPCRPWTPRPRPSRRVPRASGRPTPGRVAEPRTAIRPRAACGAGSRWRTPGRTCTGRCWNRWRSAAGPSWRLSTRPGWTTASSSSPGAAPAAASGCRSTPTFSAARCCAWTRASQ